MLLALETSTTRGSLALFNGTDLLARHELVHDQTTACALLPAVEGLLAGHRLRPQSIEHVALSIGPGSFTGLRIAVAFAKVFAYAGGAQLIAVPTLAALALAAADGPASRDRASGSIQAGRIHILADAQRGQVFHQAFELNHEWPVAASPLRIARLEELLAEFEFRDRISGPALFQCEEACRKGASAAIVARDRWKADAVAVGRYGCWLRDRGETETAWNLKPEYGRPSAAEERRRGV